MRGAVEYFYEALLPVYSQMPSFFRDYGYKTPKDGAVWQYVKGTDQALYPWLSERPDKAAMFQSVTAGYTSDRPNWISVYPTSELLAQQQSQVPLIVDVAGGSGQDLQRFCELHGAAITSPLILQDQPAVIERAVSSHLHPSITPMAHEFFQVQPVQGAAYYLHTVFLNWDDEHAVKTLRNLKPALKKGYSRILINEAVLESHPYSSPTDLAMMGLLTAKVRSEQN